MSGFDKLTYKTTLYNIYYVNLDKKDYSRPLNRSALFRSVY